MNRANARFGIIFSSHAFLLVERREFLESKPGLISGTNALSLLSFLLSPSLVEERQAIIFSRPLTTFSSKMHVHSRNNSRWTIPAPSVSFVALLVALFLRDLPEFAIALSSTSPRLPLSACDPSLEDHQEESDSQEEDPDRSGDYRSNSKNSRVKSTLPQSRWTRSQGSSGPAGSGTQQHVATLNSGLPLCIELVCSEPSVSFPSQFFLNYFA